jgi:hypothetical protein
MSGADKDFNSRVILFKTETVEGTDAGPVVAADAYRVLGYAPTFMDADQKVRRLDKAYFGADPVTMAGFKRGAKFQMELTGGGAAATTPPWMKLLAYCGFGAPTVGGSSVTLAPITPNIGAATHYGYLDDLLVKSLGTRGSVGFTIEDDENPILDISMLGRPPASLADQAAPGVPTITGYIDPVLASTENTTATFDGYAAGLRRFTLSDNAQLNLRSLINPQDRILYSGRSWSGQMVIAIGDLGTKNYFTKIRPGSTFPAQVVHGSTPGNIVQIDVPRLQITGNVELSEEQGKVMGTFPVTALPNTGNDELLFTTK